MFPEENHKAVAQNAQDTCQAEKNNPASGKTIVIKQPGDQTAQQSLDLAKSRNTGISILNTFKFTSFIFQIANIFKINFQIYIKKQLNMIIAKKKRAMLTVTKQE